jgi:hypothetical protein
MQQEVARTLPGGNALAGQYAPLVALGLPVRTVVPFRTVNADPYAEGIRYVVAGQGLPVWLAGRVDVWARRHALACFEWGGRRDRTCLYRLP